MATYNKSTPNPYSVAQLQAEINASPDIVPSCTSINATGEDLVLEFASALTTGSPSEENELDKLIAAHVPLQQEIDAIQLPFSDLDGAGSKKKISVHTSYKPQVGSQTYAVWTGAGDDLSASPSGLGEGPMLHWDMSPQPGSPPPVQEVTVKLEFDSIHGRIWVHEGYLKFNNGGCGDYMESYVMSYATPLQTAVDKILYIEDNWIKYAVGSPYPATHGWAGTPVLIPRPFSQDGDWDYDGTTLTPNLAGTGGYKISDIERRVHKYFNKIPCSGSSPYFSMTSDETTEIPQGYFIKITAYNVSNTTWDASIIIEIYRERTYVP